MAQLFILTGAECLRHQDAKALCDTLNDAEHQPVHPVRRADGGEGGHSERFSYYHGIYHRIELLKNISNHQRQRKGKDEESRFPFCHSFGV